METSSKFFASIYLKILFILAHTRCEMGTDTYMYVLAYIACILEAAAGAFICT